MAKLIYFIPMSLDGFIADGSYDWSAPDEEVMTLINDLHRPIGTSLYGRRNYETMAVWETPEVIPGLTPTSKDFAKIWQGIEKRVYSRTLETVSTSKTYLEGEFEPQAVADLKTKSPHDMTVAGPNLAAQAIKAGLVDECQLLVVPIMLGGGIPVLPRDIIVKLDLLEERRVGNGWLYLHYRIVR